MQDHPGRSDDSLPARRAQAPPLTAPPADYADDYQQDVPPPMGGKKVSFRLVTRALRRHWWQALLLWLVGTGGLVAFAYTNIQPTFDAISEVRVETDDTKVFGSGTHQTDFGQFMRVQASTIANPIIIGAALSEHPELINSSILKRSEDRELDIRQALNVNIIPQTPLIQVRMSSPMPGEAAKLVNAVVEAYLKYASAIYDSSNTKRIELLRTTRDEQKTEVMNQRKLVHSLLEQIGETERSEVVGKNTTSIEAYKRLSEELTNVEIMVITAKAKLDQLRNLKELPRQQPAGDHAADQLQFQVTDLFLSHPEVTALQARIDQATAKLKHAERLARNPGDPSRVQASEKVKDLNDQREDLWRKLEPVLRRQLASAPVDVNVENAIREAEIDLGAKAVQRDTLQGKLDQVKIANRGAQADQNKLNYAQRDLARAEGVLDRIEETLNQYRFESRNPTARVVLGYEATPSIRPNGDRRKQVIIAAPVITGMLVVGLMMLLEFRGGRVSDPDELSSRMHLQVIGVVPPLPQIRIASVSRNGVGLPATSGDLRAQRQLDEFVQSLDHLRVALCARRDQWGRDRHCVLITSACGSEGKTTLAAQLAERCVNAGLMTLLIDADLRNPTLSRMLDASESPGLINVLRGEMLAEDVVTVVGDAGGFHLLPAGTPRVDPSRLLQGERLGKLIAQARESFEMIIVDAPPVLPVPDALTIGRWTDGAVLAVRYDTSRYPLVERANRRLAHVGVPVIGVVVNGVRSMESTYGGYYGYGYGSSVYGNVPTTTVEE